MAYARIDAGRVVERVRVDPHGIFTPVYASHFVECPDAVDVGWAWDGETFAPPAPDPFDRAAAVRRIDDAVAAIYARPYRFVTEYEEREAQALAYRDAGYEGEVPPRIVEFCEPAGIPAAAATDLILAQAAALRDAQSQLSALRMRKYQVLNAADDEAAAAAAAEILAAIAVIDAQVT